jgi:hypothetical protein
MQKFKSIGIGILILTVSMLVIPGSNYVARGQPTASTPFPPKATAQLSGTLGALWKYMSSKAGLYNSGYIHGQTTIQSLAQLKGWTGAVKVLLVDPKGIVIGQTDARSYGVDGKLLGKWSRTEAMTWYRR